MFILNTNKSWPSLTNWQASFCLHIYIISIRTGNHWCLPSSTIIIYLLIKWTFICIVWYKKKYFNTVYILLISAECLNASYGKWEQKWAKYTAWYKLAKEYENTIFLSRKKRSVDNQLLGKKPLWLEIIIFPSSFCLSHQEFCYYEKLNFRKYESSILSVSCMKQWLFL